MDILLITIMLYMFLTMTSLNTFKKLQNIKNNMSYELARYLHFNFYKKPYFIEYEYNTKNTFNLFIKLLGRIHTIFYRLFNLASKFFEYN